MEPLTLDEQLQALDEAIASGVLVVRYNNRTEQFHTMDDMLKARKFLMSQMHGGRRSVRVSIARFDDERG